MVRSICVCVTFARAGKDQPVSQTARLSKRPHGVMDHQQRDEAQQATIVIRSSMLDWKDRSLARCLALEGFSFLLSGRGFQSQSEEGITFVLPLMHVVRFTRGIWEVPHLYDRGGRGRRGRGNGWAVSGDTSHQLGSRRG